jgi:hypothetical protein
VCDKSHDHHRHARKEHTDVPAPSPRRSRGTRLRRRLPAVAIVLAHVGVVAWLVAPATTSNAQTADDSLVDLEVSQATGLTDGQVIDVTVTARAGVRIDPNQGHEVYICRPGVTYAASRDTLPTGGNCPRFLSVSSSSLSSKQLFPLPDGSAARTSVPVGTGTVGWPLSAPTWTLTCDHDHPCLLVAVLKVSVNGGPTTDAIDTIELTYREDNPLSGCQQATAFTSAGSDRMLSWWTDLALAGCRGSGVVTNNFAPLGEGEAISAFASGQRDLAYTASGRTDTRGFDPPTDRPAVYTPVGVNAAVIAAVGGNPLYTDPSWPVGFPRPYEDIKLTAEEAASLIALLHLDFDTRYGDAIRARNPELPPTQVYWLGDTSKVRGLIAVQGPTSVTAFTTSYLDRRAGDAWRVPVVGGGSADLGVLGAFVHAQPRIATLTEISTKSQLTALNNVTVVQSPSFPGPAWALTDYATAVELGLTPVAIENAAGAFVKPTPESLAAAVPTMTVGADGRRTPAVTTTAAGAYPITMVEYAMTPAEQLVDDECAPRTDAQQQLRTWLEFVTGAGQQELPDGIVPLTADLRAEAEASIGRVGASPSTATCAPAPNQPPTPPSNPGPTVPSALPPGSLGDGGDGSLDFGATGSVFGSSGSSSGADASATSPSTPNELAGATELADAAKPTLPPFLGVKAVSEIISPAALVLLVALTAAAAFATSGRPLPAAVGSAAGRATALAGRAVRWRPRSGRRGR